MMDNDDFHDHQEDGLPPGIEPGSPGAKIWWEKYVESKLHEGITDEMKKKYGSDVTGVYKGKPLVPGEAGAGQGDYQYMVDKLRFVNGLDYSTALKIAGKTKARMYG